MDAPILEADEVFPSQLLIRLTVLSIIKSRKHEIVNIKIQSYDGTWLCEIDGAGEKKGKQMLLEKH